MIYIMIFIFLTIIHQYSFINSFKLQSVKTTNLIMKNIASFLTLNHLQRASPPKSPSAICWINAQRAVKMSVASFLRKELKLKKLTEKLTQPSNDKFKDFLSSLKALESENYSKVLNRLSKYLILYLDWKMYQRNH